MEPTGAPTRKRIAPVLFQLTRAVNELARLPELLEALSRAACELVGADGCSILLLDEARSELLGRASWGLDRAEEQVCFKVGEGVAGWVAEHGAPALIADVQVDSRFARIPGAPASFRSLLAVPLHGRDGVAGVISVTARSTGAFGPSDETMLTHLGESIVRDMESARLYRVAITDKLTQAQNRQYLFQRLPAEIERSRRYAEPLSLALCDIDQFKRFNEMYGVPAGDFVLKELVRLARGQVRDVDALVRYGGDEVLLVLPNTPPEGALSIAERLRVSLEGAEFSWSDRRLRVTVSIGVCSTVGKALPPEVLLAEVDDAVGAAKRLGGNKVQLAANGA